MLEYRIYAVISMPFVFLADTLLAHFLRIVIIG